MTRASADRVGDQPVVLPALPNDTIRARMWRFAGVAALDRLVQAARTVARSTVAQLVATGQRRTCEWTPEKDRLLDALDDAGVTPRLTARDGELAEVRNLAQALAAYELAWVDGGAATCLVALGLAREPILAAGTPAQQQVYLAAGGDEPRPGRRPPRGAFCLTEPLPYAGVDTGVLSGRVRVAQWEPGGEPILHVRKRGRFINNMDFAEFAVVAVSSGDERISGSCLILLREDDPGRFDRGRVTAKLVHQLTSTRDPEFDMKVPASRIVGGYEVVDGKIVPNWSHGRVLETVFSRTRVPAGVMTGAKLLSAIEPIIRYQRERFRVAGVERSALPGASIAPAASRPGTPRYELGLQTKEDALHRLVEIWSAGEAACSLGFAAARHFDSYTQLERDRARVFREAGLPVPKTAHRLPKQAEQRALEYLELSVLPPEERDARETDRLGQLEGSALVELVTAQATARVLSPATKLWNTGQGAAQLRQAVSLMGGYGITAECPGFLPQKWMDAQLEATYEGPESVQRRQLIVTMTSELFLAQFRKWLADMGEIASQRPGTGACTLAAAMRLWLWTLHHLQHAKDADGRPLYRDHRQGATFPLADALCWLLASHFQILDVVELGRHADSDADDGAGLSAYVSFFTDLCHVQAARAAGEVARICSELVFGYNRHPSWDPECGRCMQADDLEQLEQLMPGMAVGVRLAGDVIEQDGSHAPKAGPCVRFEGLAAFCQQRDKLDGCLTGARLAKDRAAQALTQVPIPDRLDYPRWK